MGTDPSLGRADILLLVAALAMPVAAQAPQNAMPPPASATATAPTPQGPPQPAPEVVTRISERPLTMADVAAPKRFVTRHQTSIRGRRLSYTATAGETYITNLFGEPTASIFSFAYVKNGPRDPSRPVLFVFNGGPGSASLWLHMGVIGPRRLVLDQEVNPSNTPPFGLRDNPFSPLDAADLVFIDPVGTGFSRAVGNARNSDFFGIDEDADSIARYIEMWLTENGRWNSPKYLMGESYGVTRAAVLPRALMGGPLYGGVMRGITVNGVVLVSGGLGLGGPPSGQSGQPPTAPDPRQGLALPTLAVTAWYHNRIDRGGRTAAQIYEQAMEFGTGDYAAALFRLDTGLLGEAEKARVAERLAALTGLSAKAWVGSNLRIPMQRFQRELLADQGLEVGSYDSRYTLPLANSGNDPVADDPAMGRYTPGFVAAFHVMMRNELGVNLPVPYNSNTGANHNFTWNRKRPAAGPGATPGGDLAMAMRRTPALRVLVATGYYDMGATPASAMYQFERSTLPRDRVTLRNYESGHMLYLGETAESFANDVRSLMLGTLR